jgi:hypothetical protein
VFGSPSGRKPAPIELFITLEDFANFACTEF